MSRSLGMTTTRILAALRDDARYGLDLVEVTGLSSGTVYPTLGRLEKRGHVRGRWEDPALAVEEGRPRRRYYELTPEGREALDEALRHFRRLRPGAGEIEGERLAEEGGG